MYGLQVLLFGEYILLYLILGVNGEWRIKGLKCVELEVNYEKVFKLLDVYS